MPGADHFGNNWAYIRHCWTVYENIDRVPDMTPEEKNYVKAEALALIAYRYMGMFYRYGGLPIVRKSFTSPADPEVSMGRSSLSETLDYILELCQKAYDGLPEGDWSAADQGRMTRGAVLAIKARTLLFAARPLFNSATPYIESAHNDLVCFGSSDPERWNTAIGANEDVLEWALEYNYRLLNTAEPVSASPTPTPSPTTPRRPPRRPTARCCWLTSATRPTSGRGPAVRSSTTTIIRITGPTTGTIRI